MLVFNVEFNNLINKLNRSDVIIQGEKGEKGERGLTTTLDGSSFPTGFIEGPPGPPGPPGPAGPPGKKVRRFLYNKFY